MYCIREKWNAMEAMIEKNICRPWRIVQPDAKATQGCLFTHLRRLDTRRTDTYVIVRHPQGPKLVRKNIMRTTTCTNLHNLRRLSL